MSKIYYKWKKLGETNMFPHDTKGGGIEMHLPWRNSR